MRRTPIDIGQHRTLHRPDDPPQPGDGWCIAEHRCWRPGVYTTEQAALFAFEFCDDVLREIQNRVAPNCVTIDDLNAAPERVCAGCLKANS